MSRPPILTAAVLATLGTITLAGTATAQAPGARQLSWQGRPEVIVQPAQPVAAAPGQRVARRPNPVIPHGGMAAVPLPRPGLTPAPGGTPGRLTPANAWMRPAVVVDAAPPAPTATAMVEPAPSGTPLQMSVAPPPSRVLPDFLPDQGGQPAPSTVIQPQRPDEVMAAPVTADTGIDPMAPRRDAPIFRMAQDAAPRPVDAQETAEIPAPPRPARGDQARAEPVRMAVARNTADRPPAQGARYYSVHRQNGQQPDALVMPEPTYVDALTLTLPDTPASQDLAEPEAGPTLIRDNQGRMRAAPAASDGDHQ